MFGDKTSSEILKIPLSDDTILKKINDMSVNIEKNINKRLTNNYFTQQIDKSTDISGKEQLIGFIFFILNNKFLFCKKLL